MNYIESRKREQADGQLDNSNGKHFSGKKMKTDVDATESVTSESASSGSVDGAADRVQKISMAFRTILEVLINIIKFFQHTSSLNRVIVFG